MSKGDFKPRQFNQGKVVLPLLGPPISSNFRPRVLPRLSGSKAENKKWEKGKVRGEKAVIKEWDPNSSSFALVSLTKVGAARV